MRFRLKAPLEVGVIHHSSSTTGYRSISFASSAASCWREVGHRELQLRIRVFSNDVYVTTRVALAVARTIASATGARVLRPLGEERRVV